MTSFISLSVGKVLHSCLNSSFPTHVPLQLFTMSALPHGLCVRVCVCVSGLGAGWKFVFSHAASNLHKRDVTFQYKQKQHVDGVVTMQVTICIKRRTLGQDK